MLFLGKRSTFSTTPSREIAVKREPINSEKKKKKKTDILYSEKQSVPRLLQIDANQTELIASRAIKSIVRLTNHSMPAN